MYHRIADEPFDPWGLAVSPAKFAQQLSWLATHRSLLSVSTFAELHRGGRLPDDAIAVTFDDGYACTATVAAPLLERYGVPATVYLPAGLIGDTRPLWWDELRHLVMTHPDAKLDALGRTFFIGERHVRDAVWPRDNRRRTPRQSGFSTLWAALQPLPSNEIGRVLAGLRDQNPPAFPEERLRLMTQDEIHSIRSDKIEFGSHALTHISLPSLGRAEKAQEIGESLAACERLVGARPVSFAYPFGDFDAECEQLVAEAGFTCACTVERRAVAPHDDLFRLPRVKAGNWTSSQLRQALADVAYAA
jgi:peptidoglycan/xylan/chitin deacetylase (PgdA/CDA1 family)